MSARVANVIAFAAPCRLLLVGDEPVVARVVRWVQQEPDETFWNVRNAGSKTVAAIRAAIPRATEAAVPCPHCGGSGLVQR